METPDVTRAQLGSLTQFVAAAGAVAALDVSNAVAIAIVAGSALIAVATVVSDALIRRGRVSVALEQAAERRTMELAELFAGVEEGAVEEELDSAQAVDANGEAL